MTPEKLLDILSKAAELKTTTRHCFTGDNRKESVADHSWRIALMAMLLAKEEEFQELDMGRVIRMCLIHDLGECFTGDIPVFRKTPADEEREEALLFAWVDALPGPLDAEMRALYADISARETLEARIYKALDGMEAVLQHNESDIRSWEPHEYELNLTYAADRTDFSPYLTRLRQAIREETEAKIQKAE